VSGRELWKWWALGLLLAMAGVPVMAKVEPKSPVGVTISMHNDAAAPWETIRAAERKASHVFSEAGIAVEWVNCRAGSEEFLEREKSRSGGEAIYPEHLELRIVKRVGVSALFFSDQESAKMKARLGSVEAHRNHARLASDAYSN